MAEETNVQGTENTAQEQEKTFTQADVDKICLLYTSDAADE